MREINLDMRIYSNRVYRCTYRGQFHPVFVVVDFLHDNVHNIHLALGNNIGESVTSYIARATTYHMIMD